MWRAKRKDPFQEALSAGNSCAWDSDWAGAAKAYKRAAEQRPEDPIVHMNLGLAYLNLGQLQNALAEYQRTDQLKAGDPVAKTKVAELHEQLGQHEAAAQTYLILAKLYEAEGSGQQAISALKAAVRLSPNLYEAHKNLSAAALRMGHTELAVESLLSMAKIHQQNQELGQAIAMCRQARELAPHNVHVQQVEERLRQGAPLGNDAKPESEPDDQEEEEHTLVQEATARAVTRLAERVFQETEPTATDTTSKAEIGALIAKALSCQKQGLAEEAIRYYEAIINAGQQAPEVLFNLGRLYQEALRLDEAIAYLSRTTDTPDFAMASHLSLGQCYQLQGKFDQALEHFLEAVKIVDLRTVGRDQADDLIQLYGQLADSYGAKGDSEKAMAFAGALSSFLQEKGWEDKALEARRRMQILAPQGETISLVEILEKPGTDEVLGTLATSKELAAQGQYAAATDVCFWALGKAPDYLPLHQQLADILASTDRVEDATEKYRTIAEVYAVRGQQGKAIATCERVLEIAPMSTNVHTRIRELLIGQGELDKALEHYLSLADTNYRMAELDEATKQYKKALLLASRGSPDRQWEIRIQRRLADIYMQRLQWGKAVEGYEYILARQPDDQEILIQLLELYRKLGNKSKAREVVKALTHLYQEQGNTHAIIEILEEEAELTPDDVDLRIYLGEICSKAGRKKLAMDAWSEALQLQLAQGQRSQASATIRRIIALNPPNVSAYKKLLATL